MPYFDRFDICEAYYCFSYLFHTGMNSREYGRFSQLDRVGFKPKPSLTTGKRLGLTENGYEIFKSLVAKLREVTKNVDGIHKSTCKIENHSQT